MECHQVFDLPKEFLTNYYTCIFWETCKHTLKLPTVDGWNPAFTSWYGKYPIIYKVLHIQTVVVWDFLHQQSIVNPHQEFAVGLLFAVTTFSGSEQHTFMGAAGKGDNLRFAICQYMSYFPFFGGKFFKTKDHPNLGAENEGANRKS